MPAKARTIAFLPLAAVLVLACSCASRERLPPRAQLPDATDLKPPAKPKLDPTALGSDQALNAHDDAVEAWGDGMFLQIGRLCRWAEAHGAKLGCPPPGE